MAETMRQRRAGALRSLNLILWLAFSLFAFAVILVCVLLQNLLVGKNYKQSAYETLKASSARIAELLAAGGGAEEAASIASEQGISAYLIYDTNGVGENDRSVVAIYGAERSYEDLAGLADLLGGEEEGKCFSGDGEIACVAPAEYSGRAAFLCLFLSLRPLEGFEAAFRSVSVVTGLAAVVLGFAASGLVALLVTRPVTEVTDRAKELARGNYSLNFKKDYFCLEIDELSYALEYARSEISKADSLQRELIANVSHDFKTPLTMIKAYASMIREISGDNREKRDRDAQVIIDEADRLALLVSDVLDLSKLRAGIEEEQVLFDLSEETRVIVERFDYLEETQGYQIETEIEDGLNITAARARIGQVVYNLVGNAVNYAGEEKTVRVKLFRKGEAARLEVIDSGKGIPPEELEFIWDRYYRSEQAHMRPVQGTGLGLSIVKSVLLAHGFPFGVVSEQGKGSCFWVEFMKEEKKPKKPAGRKGRKA